MSKGILKITTSSAMEKTIAELVIIFLFMSFFIVYSINPIENSDNSVSENAEKDIGIDLKTQNYQDGFFARLYEGISDNKFQSCLVNDNNGKRERGYARLADFAFFAGVNDDFTKIKGERKSCLEGACDAIFSYIYNQKEFVSEIYLIGRSSSDWLGPYDKDLCASAQDCNMYLSLNRSRRIFSLCRSVFAKNSDRYEWFNEFVIPTGRGSVFSLQDYVEEDRRVDIKVRFNQNKLLD